MHVEPTKGHSLTRVVLASAAGTTFEWYDFFLFVPLAGIISKLFFAGLNDTAAYVFALLSFGAGLILRPVGALIFGWTGDRVGRKATFLITITLMGAATFSIGFLPTYADAGILSPILFIGLRMLQGIAIGGEWGGAAIYIAEHAPVNRRGFLTGCLGTCAAFGLGGALIVTLITRTIVGEEAFVVWGWRVPFLLSAVLVAIGYWVRVSIAESPLFQKAMDDAGAPPKSPVLDALQQRPGGLAIGAGLRVAENISFYLITTYAISYMTETVHLSRTFALNAMLAGAAVEIVAIPLFASLSDRIGRRPVYFIGAAGMALWGFAFFRMIDTGLTPNVLIAVIVGLVLHGAMYGPQAAFIAELFPTRMRYSGASLAYQATSIFAGSLAPIIALALYRHYNSWTPIAIYLAVAGGISAISALMARETKGLSFEEIDQLA